MPGGSLVADYNLPEAVRIGHVHLTVSDLAQAERFYCGLLGFSVTQRWADEALFVSAGGYHHHIGLNIWAGRGATPPPPGHTGLYHVAILYPSRRALAAAYLRLQAARYPIDGAADHGVSEAIYLHDPDQNGIEIYRDRPQAEWPRDAGGVAMGTRRLDLEGLLAAAGDEGDTVRGADLRAALASLPHFRGDEEALAAEISFPSFAEAVGFIDQVARLAEAANHHPDIDLRFRQVRLSLRSHDTHGVSPRDLRLAEAIEGLFAQHQGR